MAFPSTFLDIQNAVIAKAALSATGDLQAVKDWINQAYTEVFVETEASIQQGTTTLTVNVASYTLDAAVARLRQMFVTPAGQTSVYEQPPMERATLDDILVRRQTNGITATAGSYCTHYALVGARGLEVWPTPAAADVITMFYAAFPTALSSNADVPALDEPYASKLLEYGALVQAGEFKGDPATGDWQAKYASWADRYARHLDQKQGDIPGTHHTWGSLQDTQGLYRGW